MSDPLIDPVSGLPTRAPTVAELRRETKTSFEVIAADFFCMRYCSPAVRMRIAQDHASRTGGTPQLSFESFYEMFPAYPMYFSVVSSPSLAYSTSLASLLWDFDRSELVNKYEEAWAVRSDHRRYIGLLLQWPPLQATSGFASNCLVIHNAQFPHDIPGSRLIWKSPGGMVLCVQAWLTLLKDLDHVWPAETWGRTQ